MGVLLFKDHFKAMDVFGYIIKVDQYNVGSPHFQCLTGQQAGICTRASENLSLLRT